MAFLIVVSAGCIHPDLPTQEPTAVRIGFNMDETQDRLTVTVVPSSGAGWNRFGFLLASCNQPGPSGVTVRMGQEPSPYYNEVAATSGAALNAASTGTSCGASSEKQLDTAPSQIAAGMYVEFCAAPAKPTLVKIQIRDRTANELIFEQTFTDVAVCET